MVGLVARLSILSIYLTDRDLHYEILLYSKNGVKS
jgi:hypothetical protein